MYHRRHHHHHCTTTDLPNLQRVKVFCCFQQATKQSSEMMASLTFSFSREISQHIGCFFILFLSLFGSFGLSHSHTAFHLCPFILLGTTDISSAHCSAEICDAIQIGAKKLLALLKTLTH